MKLLKGFLLTLGGLFTMIFLVSLLMPSGLRTVKTVVIHSDAKKVFIEVTDLKNWKRWHPVFMDDSANMAISNPSSGENAFARWKRNGQNNELIIKKILPDHLEVSLRRDNEHDVKYIISITPANAGNAVQVEWQVVIKLKWYPWEKFSGIFIDKLTGPGYEATLNNLKDLVENKK